MTRKYIVVIDHLFKHRVEIEGENIDDIKEKITKLLANNDPVLGELYYSGTINEEEWFIKDKKDVVKQLVENKIK